MLAAHASGHYIYLAGQPLPLPSVKHEQILAIAHIIRPQKKGKTGAIGICSLMLTEFLLSLGTPQLNAAACIFYRDE